MNARERILGRIRAHRRTSAEQAPHTPLPRIVFSPEERTDKFERMLDKVEATHERCRSTDDARRAIERVCLAHKCQGIAVSDSPLARELTLGIELQCHRDADRATLLAVDAGLCTAQLGIAETGTLVLNHDIERHREVSLLPPIHIAIVRTEDIVDSLDSALAAIAERDEKPPRAISFITGASRTADIELTLITGVHGPKSVHVIILENSP